MDRSHVRAVRIFDSDYIMIYECYYYNWDGPTLCLRSHVYCYWSIDWCLVLNLAVYFSDDYLNILFRYNICIRKNAGFCCVQYVSCPNILYAFTLDTSIAANAINGFIDTSCINDYITIAGKCIVVNQGEEIWTSWSKTNVILFVVYLSTSQVSIH